MGEHSENIVFTVACWKPHENQPYWTASLVGNDPKELNLRATGSSEESAIFAVLDLYVGGSSSANTKDGEG